MNVDVKPVIAVNTNKYLPYSETFIKNHIEGLSDFVPVVLASERLVDGIHPKCRSEFIIKDSFLGQVKDIMYKLGFSIPSMNDYLREHNVKLIHSHFGQNGYASINVATKLCVPHITTFHGLDISIDNVNPRQHGKLLSRFHKNFAHLKNNGDLFIAVSDFIRRKLLDKGFPEEKVITNYIGIDTCFFKPQQKSVRSNTIVCVARHVEYKGLSYLIQAMAKINNSHPEWQLVLIGDGALTNKLKNLANIINANIEFRGRLSTEEIKEELSKAKIYCQPSIRLDNGHEEALALTIVEAQAMGVPAVVFNSGGMPEAIAPGVSGFVVEEKDINGLANKILSLIEDEQKWDEFSQAAIVHANENHCFEKQINKLEIIYKNLIEKRKK